LRLKIEALKETLMRLIFQLSHLHPSPTLAFVAAVLAFSATLIVLALAAANADQAGWPDATLVQALRQDDVVSR
jgi:hypothetical protein